MKRGEIIFSESCSEGEGEEEEEGASDGSDSLLILSEASQLRYPLSP